MENNKNFMVSGTNVYKMGAMENIFNEYFDTKEDAMNYLLNEIHIISYEKDNGIQKTYLEEVHFELIETIPKENNLDDSLDFTELNSDESPAYRTIRHTVVCDNNGDILISSTGMEKALGINNDIENATKHEATKDYVNEILANNDIEIDKDRVSINNDEIIDALDKNNINEALAFSIYGMSYEVVKDIYGTEKLEICKEIYDLNINDLEKRLDRFENEEKIENKSEEVPLEATEKYIITKKECFEFNNHGPIEVLCECRSLNSVKNVLTCERTNIAIGETKPNENSLYTTYEIFRVPKNFDTDKVNIYGNNNELYDKAMENKELSFSDRYLRAEINNDGEYIIAKAEMNSVIGDSYDKMKISINDDLSKVIQKTEDLKHMLYEYNDFNKYINHNNVSYDNSNYNVFEYKNISEGKIDNTIKMIAPNINILRQMKIKEIATADISKLETLKSELPQEFKEKFEEKYTDIENSKNEFENIKDYLNDYYEDHGKVEY